MLNLAQPGLPIIKDWHRPSNESCANNIDPDKDCTCKLVIKSNGKRRAKPRIIFRAVDTTVGRRVNHNLVAELHDNGVLIIRESKRRASSAVATTLGAIYTDLVHRRAVKLANERRAARRAKRGRKH